MRAVRQPHRADEVGEHGDLPPGSRVAGVHGVPGSQHGYQAAGPGQVQRLDDEVVVDAVPTTVVPAVAELHRAERNVADDQVEGALGGAGIGEGLVADLRVRVQRRRELRGDGFQFHASDLGAVGGEGNEVSRSAAWLQHPAAGEAEVPHPRPDCLDQIRVGVVRVEGVAGGGCQLLRRQERGQFRAGRGELLPCGVEHFRDRAPSRPAGQDGLLVPGRRPASQLDTAQRREGSQVRADPGDRSGRCQVILALRSEPLRS